MTEKNFLEIKAVKGSLKPIITKVPGSKSYTNRALLLASLAKGTSKLGGALESKDTQVMIRALRALGISINKTKTGLTVKGSAGTFKKPGKIINLENAGTAVRSLTAALATQSFNSKITGDKRMQTRPIQDLIDALIQLGASIQTNKGCPPVTILKPIKGGKTCVNGNISSQYLSALLMALPLTGKTSQIKVKGKLTSLPYVEMTLETMRRFGVHVQNKNFREFIIKPQTYKAANYEVEGDASSATYPLALAALHSGKTTITNLPGESLQADLQFLHILQKMGCTISKSKTSVSVKGPKKLNPLGTIDLNRLPDATMTVTILCAFAKGTSKLTGLANLRIKECDRLRALATELKKIGATVQEGKTFLIIMGNPLLLHGTEIETYNDHRMAMCFAIAASKIGNIKIKNPSCTKKTYPDFWKDLKKWGMEWS
ncbi:3-phosphoshikimate 1-carboxyvinyltransferase [Patescibacteria group bacterium]|nr:3-phosphoshikimate 1-carboxyvinyltransferase [Patescibacteria group bacterium]MBU1702777.1 3-phosphoshikimate 1-carboxyvinyltransferase [Patescibacteria group bacterium]MBU1954089.1 3-phosphoshikimate 1-carboxyvinyltransferase [Patescibacteria group bacterium]